MAVMILSIATCPMTAKSAINLEMVVPILKHLIGVSVLIEVGKNMGVVKSR